MHGQTFAEVRDNRRFDDFTDAAGDLLLRLGHQTAHTGQLTNLIFGTTSAGIGHHEDRIEPMVLRRQIR